MGYNLRDALKKEWFQSAIAIKRMPGGDCDITIEELIKTRPYRNSVDYSAGTLVIYQTDAGNKLYFNRYSINANNECTNPRDDSSNWQELQIYETFGPSSGAGRSSPAFCLVEPPEDLKYSHGDHLFSKTVDTSRARGSLCRGFT